MIVRTRCFRPKRCLTKSALSASSSGSLTGGVHLREASSGATMPRPGPCAPERLALSDAEKDLGSGLGARLRVAQGAVVVGRRVAVAAAARRDQLARELVERLVLGDAAADPVVEQRDALLVQHLLLVAQQIRPFQRPEV